MLLFDLWKNNCGHADWNEQAQVDFSPFSKKTVHAIDIEFLRTLRSYYYIVDDQDELYYNLWYNLENV